MFSNLNFIVMSLQNATNYFHLHHIPENARNGTETNKGDNPTNISDKNGGDENQREKQKKTEEEKV